MPLADYVPQFNDGNLSTYYRNVLGVPVRKRVVIAFLTVLVLLLVCVIALVYANRLKVQEEECQVPVLPYVPIANSVNLSVDPCENFYDFACGLWAEDELVADQEGLSETYTTLSHFVDARKKELFLNAKISEDLPRVVNDALMFYNTCMSLSSAHDIEIDFFMKYYKDLLGGWPILNQRSWDGTNFDWMEVSAHLLRTMNVKTIVDISNTVDDYDSTRRVLYLSPPDFEKGTLKDFGSLYVLASVFNCLNHSDINIENVTESIHAISETEMKWLEYFDIKHNIHTNHTRMTIKDLKEKMPNFDWLRYVQLVFDDKNGELFSDSDIVYVDNMEFLNGAMAKFQMESFTKLELANLFGWFILQQVWFFVPGAVRMYSQYFDETEEQMKRNADFKCWRAVEDLYDCGIDYLYVQNASHSGIEDGKILIKKIKTALQDLIRRSEWMDDSTSSSALKKLDSMKSVIGLKKYLMKKSEFENLFRDFPPFSSCVMQATVEIRSYFREMVIVGEIKFQNYTKHVTLRPISTVSAYYQPHRNSLTIPLSIFNPPYYHYNSPWYLNFGALGTIIAHEVMHGFDSLGRQRGELGTLHNWWSNKTLEVYKERSLCFENQYNSYKTANISDIDVKSVGEDIADSEGLHIAYLAYTEWIKVNGKEHPYFIKERQFTPEQAFFISFGSVWCSKPKQPDERPSHHSHHIDRIIGAISNSEEFSRVFNCPAGSPMNPEIKCHMW